jgi:hypothetical protein
LTTRERSLRLRIVFGRRLTVPVSVGCGRPAVAAMVTALSKSRARSKQARIGTPMNCTAGPSRPGWSSCIHAISRCALTPPIWHSVLARRTAPMPLAKADGYRGHRITTRNSLKSRYWKSAVGTRLAVSHRGNWPTSSALAGRLSASSSHGEHGDTSRGCL